MTAQDTSQDASRQPLLFSTPDFPSPQEGFERYRALIAEVCDVAVLGEIAHFKILSSSLHLGGAVLLDTRSTALRYDRTRDHVARGVDHFQATLYFAGGVEFFAADRTFLQRTGDICLIDMSQPNEARVMTAADGMSHGVSFLLPRMLLAPYFPAADTIPPIAIVARETVYGRLIADYMLRLRQSAAELTQGENQAALQALAQLVAAGAAQQSETDIIASLSQEGLRARIKQHVEDNLGQASLGVDALCSRFELSRAGLYRLFAPTSPAGYIQERRLHRAYAMLISPAFRTWRIIDIAVECRFSSDATFIRASAVSSASRPARCASSPTAKSPARPLATPRRSPSRMPNRRAGSRSSPAPCRFLPCAIERAA
jgi:AraC-like DNA-binding protein